MYQLMHDQLAQGLEKKIIITFDDEEVIKYDGLTISVIPFWRWVTFKEL